MRLFARLVAFSSLAVIFGCGAIVNSAGPMPAENGPPAPDSLGPLSQVLSEQDVEAPSGPAFLSDEARNTKDLLYAAHGDEILIFPQRGVHRQSVIGRITDGIRSPWGMSVDSSGTLYVANHTRLGSVAIYPKGSIEPSLTLTAGLSYPTSVGVDSNGTVYVCNDRTGEVWEFPAGQTSPSLVIPAVSESSVYHLFPTDAILDRDNNLYVAYVDPYGSGGDYGFGIVYKYKPGSTKRIATGVMPHWVGDIQLDGAGHLLLAVPTIAGFPPTGVLVYHLQPGKLLRHFGDEKGAWAMRFASGGNRLFVGDPQQEKIFVYGYPSGKFMYMIGGLYRHIKGLAASPPAQF